MLQHMGHKKQPTRVVRSWCHAHPEKLVRVVATTERCTSSCLQLTTFWLLHGLVCCLLCLLLLAIYELPISHFISALPFLPAATKAVLAVIIHPELFLQQLPIQTREC